MDCEIPIGARFSILHRSFRRRIDELIGEQGLTGVQGFVSCRVSTRDRRSKCIVSAPMAGEVFRCMDSLDHTVFDELCRGLSEEQTAEFLNTTDIMLKNAMDMYPAQCLGGKGCDGT